MTQGELPVRRFVEILAVEANGIAEAHGGGDAVDVHVVDARMDVVAALAQLFERARLHAVFLVWPPDNGVQTNQRMDMALLGPVVIAVLVCPVLGCAGQQPDGPQRPGRASND
ncbi:MAG: hypothetical protein JWO52_763 [Gammaproteobacteria bacterium]|jgi:hypothetical protein|nr:hypothetical protein [Gammaproteobacteria bacterium]